MASKRLCRLCIVLLVWCLAPLSGSAARRPLSHYLIDTTGAGIRFDPAEEGFFYRHFVDSKGAALLHVEGKGVALIVEARVSFDPTKRDYRYHYKLDNERSNREVMEFEVIFDSPLPPDTVSFRVGEGSFEVVCDPPLSVYVYDFTVPSDEWGIGGAMIKEETPEGGWKWVKRPPYRWSGALSYGKSLEGFSLKSRALPGITSCWSSIFVPDAVPGSAVFLRGKTIGPVALPEEFDPQRFLERITSIVDESLTEGWIEDEGVAKGLKKRLELARGAIRVENGKRVESILKDFLKEVQEERERSLLSEAYGLLKFNVQYWLEQLREGQE